VRERPELSDIVLRYSHRHAADDADEDRSVERWDVEISLDPDGGEETEVIGKVTAYVVRYVEGWIAGVDVVGILDSETDDVGQMAEVIFSPEQSALSETVETFLDGCSEGSALFVSEMVLTPPYRGQGLGPTLLGLVIRKLGRGCGFAALVPGSLEGHLSEAESDHARQALTRTWAKLGFEKVEDDVMMVNLTKTTFGEQLDALLRARS
jgi:GNAT superfamily N-acetyltransferase